MACRISRSAEWSARLMHELDYFEKAAFVTLTYNSTSVPRIGRHLSLRKVDLQLAIKRLRKALPGRCVKYFAVGEYGDRLCRPHYHLILLGVGYDEHESIKSGGLKGVCISGPLVDAWPYGHVFVGTVTADSCRYVADYLKKVWKGKRASVVYGACEQPFQLVSQGIGKRYALKNAKQLRALLGLTVKGEQVGLPRYYRKVLDITCENTPLLAERGIKATQANWERKVERALKKGDVEVWSKGRLEHLTFEGVMREVLLSDRRQAERDLRKKVELHRKGKL